MYGFSSLRLRRFVWLALWSLLVTSLLASGGGTAVAVSRFQKPGVRLQPAARTIETTAGPVNIWLTTPDGQNLLTPQTAVSFAPDSSGCAGSAICVDDSTPYQQMTGFGASLTDTSSHLIFNSPARNAIMQSLFDPTQGIGLSFLRQPIGASDFTAQPSFWTYDDAPSGTCNLTSDPNLTCFSLGQDITATIPLLQQALQLNPNNLTIMATPWSAPAWMKTNNSLLANAGGGGSLRTDSINGMPVYTSYANYLVKFLQAYQAQGIPISLLTVQNEPGASSGVTGPAGAYPGMNMTATQEATFLQNYLAPALKAANLSPKLLLYDWNYDANGTTYPYPSFVSTFNNTQANWLAVAGTAVHCYTSLPASTAGVKDLYETECATSISQLYQSTSANPLAPVDLIIDGVTNGSKSIVLWNLAEDQNLGPRPQGANGCQCTPLVTVATDANGTPTGTLTYNTEYYALGHASKFVTPGAYHIASSTVNAQGLKEVVFKNQDGSLVLIAHNTATSAQMFKVLWNGQSFSYTLPAGAAATFKWASSWASLPASVQQLSQQWYFAEGYNGANYNVSFTAFNPTSSPAHLTVTYDLTSGAPIVKTYTVPPNGPMTWYANGDVPSGSSFGTQISSDQPVMAERSITFIFQGSSPITGSSAVVGATAPNTQWYFAEGYTGAGFYEYLSLLNPSSTQTANVSVTYYTQSGAPVTKTLSINPSQRSTINVNDASALGIGPNQNVSIQVTSTNGVGMVAERVLYFLFTNGNKGTGGPTTIPGGDAVVGANTLNSTFSFAEGYTGPNFNEYLTLLNPSATATTATVTYYIQGSSPVTRTKSLPAGSRQTINVWSSQDPAGLGQLSKNVSVQVTTNGAGNSVPILVERPIYFSFPNTNGSGWSASAPITGGSVVIGATTLGKTVVFAFGETQTNANEFITIENPNTVTANIMITYVAPGGFLFLKTLSVPAQSRGTIPVSQTTSGGLGPNTDTGGLSVVLTSDQPIVAERPMYLLAPNSAAAAGAALVIPGGHAIMGVSFPT